MREDTHHMLNVVPSRKRRNVLIGLSSVGLATTLTFPSMAGLAFGAVLGQLGYTIWDSMRRNRLDHVPPGALVIGRLAVRGEPMFGSRRNSGEPVALSANDLAQGVVVYGTTGSGKTELGIKLLHEAMRQGGGGIWLDGKMDVSVYARIAEIAALAGREDDVIPVMLEDVDMLRHMGEDGDPGRRPGWLPFDPLEGMGDDAAAEVILSLPWHPHGADREFAQGGGERPDADWTERARALLRAAVPVMRHRSIHRLSIRSVVWTPPNLEWFMQARDDAALPRDVRERVAAYLERLPGYVSEKGHRQSRITSEQHDSAMFSIWSDVKDLIDAVPRAFVGDEADALSMRDAVLGRKVVVIMSSSCFAHRMDDFRMLSRKTYALVVGQLERVVREERDAGRAYDRACPFLVVDDEALPDRAAMFDLCIEASRQGIGFVSFRQDAIQMTVQGAEEDVVSRRRTGTTISFRQEDISLRIGAMGVDPTEIKSLREGEFVMVRGDDVSRGSVTMAPRLGHREKMALMLGHPRMVSLPTETAR